MLVFEGSVISWGQKGYAIYVPKEYQKFIERYRGKRIIVIVLELGEQCSCRE
ncbi:MAG: hypothetical protein GXO32_05880 [Crenarchaeota archaeon]|nr:hypothetical protein [Thermoproteota archaeon]